MGTEPTVSAPAATAADAGQPLVSVLVAAYDEEATVEEILRRVADLPLRTEILAVDDGSRDGTGLLLRRLEAEGEIPGLRVLGHSRNRGKGAALRTAIAASRGDIVVVQDADLEYDPGDLPRVLEPIFDGHADVVYGTRLRGGGQPQRVHMFWHYLGNRVLSLLTNVLFNTTISDMETGHKAFRGELIRSLELTSEGFDIEPEVTAKLLRRDGLRVYEVPISYFGRGYDEGKKITWRDGLRAIKVLLRFRLRE
jgi:glycosyltransferase involved in cell wall biosynthesis